MNYLIDQICSKLQNRDDLVAGVLTETYPDSVLRKVVVMHERKVFDFLKSMLESVFARGRWLTIGNSVYKDYESIGSYKLDDDYSFYFRELDIENDQMYEFRLRLVRSSSIDFEFLF